MPTMGVCDECGMLMRLLPDGSCPNGHGRSSIRDTFETQGSSIDDGVFAPDEGEAEPRPEPAAEQTAVTEFTQPDPVVASAEPRAEVRDPVAQAEAARKMRRVIITVVVVFVALQVLCSCAGVIGSMLQSM